MTAHEDQWQWGWDPTPGIVSVWAEPSGRATVWRRVAGALVREDVRFRPWILLDRADDIAGKSVSIDSPRRSASLRAPAKPGLSIRELAGDGALRWLVRADDLDTLTRAVTRARGVGHIRDLGDDALLMLPADEQYLVASGRTYFRDLAFDDLVRMQIDLETTGLDPARDRIFAIAVRDPAGRAEVLEADDERELIAQLVAAVRAADPDVIENHNLHGFDLPFLDRRARILGVPLALGRTDDTQLRQRGARRGVANERDATRKIRFVAPGRELIDTLDAVLRHDFAARDLPGHDLKAVARHFRIAGDDRELIRGDQIYSVYRRDPDRVRRYATADVEEVAGLARLLGGPAFALAKMVPRRYERLADAGPATGVLDPLLVRAYLRSATALPAHERTDGTEHQGAALHLFNAGVAHRIVKADVASLYPSLMRTYRIGPARDRLGVLLALVDRLVEQRLAAKARARALPAGSPERLENEAMSAAMKLVVNSAYGYLGASDLTRFSDIHAANEVTRRGREVLELMCRELAARGVTLLEADTDGVYFAVPEAWTEADERRVVAEVAALLPERVQLEYDGRYAAMLSHEPKNYALLGYDGSLVMRGVAFRSSRTEPFGEAFLSEAVGKLLVGDVAGVHRAYLATITALRQRDIATHDVSSRVRLTKTPAEYMATRESRRELPYEAMLASGRTTWEAGDRVRVYRTASGASIVRDLDDDLDGGDDTGDPRDYDIEHYVRVLRDTFAQRFVRAFTPDDFATVFADEQLSLFARPLSAIRPILRVMSEDA